MGTLTRALIELKLGTKNYNLLLSLSGSGSASADNDVVDWLIDKTDEELSGSTITGGKKTTAAYKIMEYNAYVRRGPGTIPDAVLDQYAEAMKEVNSSRSVIARTVYNPIELPEQELLDQQLEDPQ